MAKNVIVADIDGCCIFSEHRIPHLMHGDMVAYHAAHVDDTPIWPGVVVYRKFLRDPSFRFFFVTGRMEKARQYTMKQLRSWVDPTISHDQLLMRPNDVHGDVMHDTELKPMLLETAEVSIPEIFLVFEDRNSIVDMWRKRGVVCYQTAPGDF